MFGSENAFSSGSLVPRYLNSEAYRRGMWHSTWKDLQNQAAREIGLGSASVAFNSGYSSEPYYGQSFVLVDNKTHYTGNYTKGYVFRKGNVELESNFMSWVNSFDRPSGGMQFFWEGVAQGGETKINRNAEIGGDIGTLVDVAGNYGGGKTHSILGYISHLLGGFSRGSDIPGWFSDVFSSEEEYSPYVPPIDTFVIQGGVFMEIQFTNVISYPDSTIYETWIADTVWNRTVHK